MKCSPPLDPGPPGPRPQALLPSPPLLQVRGAQNSVPRCLRPRPAFLVSPLVSPPGVDLDACLQPEAWGWLSGGLLPGPGTRG